MPRLAQYIKNGIKGTQVLPAAVLVHRQEHLNSSIRFAGGHVPLGDDGERLQGGAEAEGPHPGDEGPRGPVVAGARGEVDGVVEGGGGVGVGGVAGELGEESQGLWGVVPEALQGLVDKVRRPSYAGALEDSGQGLRGGGED